MTYTIPAFNIYYGTIGKTLGVKYRYTKRFRNKEEALKYAKEEATSLFYKNEGKFGIPSYIDIAKESKITELKIEDLYQDHINDLVRYYAIPVEEDSISTRKLQW